MSERKALHGYTEQGFAQVLDGAADLIQRAANLYRETKTAVTPPVVAASRYKEASVCLAEAEELIARVRECRP